MTQDGLVKAARQAAAAAKGEGAVHTPPAHTGSAVSFAKIHPGDVATEKKAQKVIEANQLARQKSDKVVQVVVNYSDKETAFHVVNSLGTSVTDGKVYTAFSVAVVTSDGERLETGRCREGYHIGFELFDRYSPEYFAEEAVRLGVLLLKAPSAPRGRMPVVIAPSFGGVLIHEACGHGLEEDHTRKGLSVFADRIGQKLADESVTIVDDGNLRGNAREHLVRRRGHTGSTERSHREWNPQGLHDRHRECSPHGITLDGERSAPVLPPSLAGSYDEHIH